MMLRFEELGRGALITNAGSRRGCRKEDVFRTG